MEKEELIERIKYDYKLQFNKEIEDSVAEKLADKYIQKQEKMDRINEQVNLIMANTQRKMLEKGLKHHTLKWSVGTMKAFQDVKRFYIQESFRPPVIDWKNEVSIKKPMDSLRCIIAYLYVKFFYYG